MPAIVAEHADAAVTFGMTPATNLGRAEHVKLSD